MMKSPFLGVCYYPEHWPEHRWIEDAQKMVALGLRQVRIGEFSWSRIEPEPGRFEWNWLDRAIETLGDAGLGVMLGTPTATPPKWLIDAYPEILAYDINGCPRKFGSRRHYCFSSEKYADETLRIVEAIAKRYGDNDYVTAWQTDNEYGCHDTVRSYSPAAKLAFQKWLQARYENVNILNKKWGNVFWSQEYHSFDQVDLPNLTVTEPSPSHLLDFYRFSSDQVVKYNRLQTKIIRQYAPNKTIAHNFMGFTFSFDHFAVANDLDIAGWDSYPIGFLDVGPFSAADKERYLRQGHPDIAGFHHDLYRAVGNGRWSVLEQQPGAVNWAPHNPAPLTGMVRLWSHEAVAHGAQNVNYFRWRQAPFAQEQMHAGLERPDFKPSPAYAEAEQTFLDLEKTHRNNNTPKAKVAIIVSYEAQWVFEAQPQGENWNYVAILFEWYAALRRFGLDVDFVSADMPINGYKIVIVPSLPILTQAQIDRFSNSVALILFGPRTGSKTPTLTIPHTLAPGLLQSLLPIKVARVESFPDFHRIDGDFDGTQVAGHSWLDHVESELSPIVSSTDGGLLYCKDNYYYLTTLPNEMFFAALVATLAQKAGVQTTLLPPDIRLRQRGDLIYAFNYGPEPVDLPTNIAPKSESYILGAQTLEPAGVAAWKIE